MARHFAPIKTSIWDDPEFTELNSDEQRLYLMLFSQSGISSVGLVPMTLKRWSNSTKGMTIKALSKTLQGLSDALFIVVDWDREELLVRSFVRHDGGYTNSLRLKAIQRESKGIGSKLLAGVLAHELNRLNIQHGISVDPYDVHSKRHRSPIEDASKGAGSGYVSTVGDGTLTGNLKPEPEPETEPPQSGLEMFEEFWSAYPRSEARKTAEAKYAQVLKRISHTELMRHLHRQLNDPNRPDFGFWPYPTTWLNQDRWNDRFIPRTKATPAPKPSTTDQRVAEGIALARRFAEQEAREEQTRLEIEA